MNRNSDISPGRFFIVLVLIILGTETLNMILLQLINLDPLVELLIDVGLLFVITLPFLYFFSFRPLALYIEKFKEKEQELLATSSNYRSLAESLPFNIFRKDKNSVYVFCNKNYADDLGILPGEIAGKTDFDFYTKEMAEKYRQDDKEVIESGQSKEVEEKYTKDGKERWVHTVKIPYKNDKEEIIGVLGVFWDVTKTKLASDELKKHTEELELLNKVTIGRELKMIELKKELEKIKGK